MKGDNNIAKVSRALIGLNAEHEKNDDNFATGRCLTTKN
jgi:hypothetical protein